MRPMKKMTNRVTTMTKKEMKAVGVVKNTKEDLKKRRTASPKMSPNPGPDQTSKTTKVMRTPMSNRAKIRLRISRIARMGLHTWPMMNKPTMMATEGRGISTSNNHKLGLRSTSRKAQRIKEVLMSQKLKLDQRENKISQVVQRTASLPRTLPQTKTFRMPLSLS